MKEYKVLTDKEGFFGNNFDTQKIETVLNGYAEQGWELKAVGRNEFPGFGGKRDEIVIFLEREKAGS